MAVEDNMGNVKKIAVFHCTAKVGSAWACAEGITLTLARMGYEVFDFGLPELGRHGIEQLQQADLIILSAPEWYADKLMARFGPAWHELKAPKVAWFAESAHRDDRDFPMGKVLALVDHGFFPAEQDAVEFGGEWLPFGADTQIFKPQPVVRQFDASFLGSMYPKRVEYVGRMGFPLTYIRAVDDPDMVRSFTALAQAYSSTRIFVNLPALSRLLVTKVTEVMACGTMLITPKPDHPSAQKNMSQFQDGVHLVYYDADRPEQLRDLVAHYLQAPDELDRIARAGLEEVASRHTLQHRVASMVAYAEAQLATRVMAA
jgi:hypothetical protein